MAVLDVTPRLLEGSEFPRWDGSSPPGPDTPQDKQNARELADPEQEAPAQPACVTLGQFDAHALDIDLELGTHPFDLLGQFAAHLFDVDLELGAHLLDFLDEAEFGLGQVAAGGRLGEIGEAFL